MSVCLGQAFGTSLACFIPIQHAEVSHKAETALQVCHDFTLLATHAQVSFEVHAWTESQ
jgi:hypothetical protein